MGLQFQMFKAPKKLPMRLEKTPLEELKKHFCKITGMTDTEYVGKNTRKTRQNKLRKNKTKKN